MYIFTRQIDHAPLESPAEGLSHRPHLRTGSLETFPDLLFLALLRETLGRSKTERWGPRSCPMREAR